MEHRDGNAAARAADTDSAVRPDAAGATVLSAVIEFGASTIAVVYIVASVAATDSSFQAQRRGCDVLAAVTGTVILNAGKTVEIKHQNRECRLEQLVLP